MRSAALNAFLAGRSFRDPDLPETVVTVICRQPGMRRAGRRHPASETYRLGEWTYDELAALDADPAFELRFDAPAVAAGADTADAVQDNGAGPPVPDLGAKPQGVGPSAAVNRDDGIVRPPVFDTSRIEAIRGRLADLGVVFADPERDPGAMVDFTKTTDEEWAQVETLVGFRPTIAEMEEAVYRHTLAATAPVDGGQDEPVTPPATEADAPAAPKRARRSAD